MYPAQLDSPQFVAQNDPSGLLKLFGQFPEQCRHALELARQASLPGVATPRLVCLTGMGGSAAGGDLVQAMFEAYADIPFLVNRDYTLPHCVGKGDLVFCVSYSGDTEETLSAYREAHRVGASVIALTSGGVLADWASDHGHPVILLPQGLPPRAALGYLTIPILVICERMGLLPAQDYLAAFDRLKQLAAEKWGASVHGDNPAKALAGVCHRRLIVLYGLGGWKSLVAGRWRGQINENAKNLAFVSAFPELDHNEVLGWTLAYQQGGGSFVGLILQDGTESAKMRARVQITADLIGPTCEFHRVTAEGVNLLERMLCLVHLADYVSLYLAALNGVDPEDIGSINRLKAELSTIVD